MRVLIFLGKGSFLECSLGKISQESLRKPGERGYYVIARGNKMVTNVQDRGIFSPYNGEQAQVPPDSAGVGVGGGGVSMNHDSNRVSEVEVA